MTSITDPEVDSLMIAETVWLTVWHHRWDSAIVVALAGTIAARTGRLSDKRRGW